MPSPGWGLVGKEVGAAPCGTAVLEEERGSVYCCSQVLSCYGHWCLTHGVPTHPACGSSCVCKGEQSLARSTGGGGLGSLPHLLALGNGLRNATTWHFLFLPEATPRSAPWTEPYVQLVTRYKQALLPRCHPLKLRQSPHWTPPVGLLSQWPVNSPICIPNTKSWLPPEPSYS